MIDDTRHKLELSVLHTALTEILDVAQTHHSSYTTLNYIAEHARTALDTIARAREQAGTRPRPPRNVIPFNPNFRRHKDPVV